MSPPLVSHVASLTCSSNWSSKLNQLPVPPHRHSWDKISLSSEVSPVAAWWYQNSWTWFLPPAHLASPAHSTHLKLPARTLGLSSKKTLPCLHRPCVFTPTWPLHLLFALPEKSLPSFLPLDSGQPSRLIQISLPLSMWKRKMSSGLRARSPSFKSSFVICRYSQADFNAHWFGKLDEVTWLLHRWCLCFCLFARPLNPPA